MSPAHLAQVFCPVAIEALRFEMLLPTGSSELSLEHTLAHKSNAYLQIVPPGYVGSTGLGSEVHVKVAAPAGGFEQGHSN